MQIRPIKPLFWGILLILVISLACNTPFSSGDTPEPTAEALNKAPEESGKEIVEAQPAGPSPVSTLQDAQNAVVQIESVGTFVDPEYGEYEGAGRGSGFIIDPSGIAVTNNHVVTGAGLLKVWIGGDTSKTYNAKILGVSECSDLAVIDIEGEGFSYLEWYSQPVNVGLDVYTAGFPLGEPEYTLTKGIVSKSSTNGETGWASVDSVLMHDATINPGNSGGPLITEDGKVVGVNYSSRADADQYFAIKYDTAIPVVEKLRQGEDVDSIGINSYAVSSEDGSLTGIWVSSVQAGSPADKAGVTGGDIILSLENLSLATDGTMADYCDILRSHISGDTMDLEILRYDSSQYMAGQINGTPLVAEMEASEPSSDGTSDSTTSPPASGEYMSISDNTGALYVEVPTDWSDISGEIWEADWGTLHFRAANVVASYNLDEYYSYYNVAGIDYAASKDWGDIGGYVQLLDDAKYTWYEDNCDFDSREDYNDGYYEGAYDLWECTPDATSVVLTARPINDPFAFLILIQMQVVTDADVDAFGRVLETFDVDPSYLP